MKTAILRQLSAEGFLVSFSLDTVDDLPITRSGGVLDLTCNFSLSVINQFTRDKTMGVHTEWLLLDDGSSLDVIKDAYILPGSFVTIAQILGEEVVYLDVYRTSPYRPLKYTVLDNQTLEQFIQLPDRPSRNDFEGISLLGAAVLYYPHMFCGFDCRDHPEVDTIAKTGFPISQHFQEQLNFTLTFQILNDYGWKTNNTFSGLMGLLQREEIDMGVIGIFMRPDRIGTVDFTGDTFEIKSLVIYKQPALSAVSNIFVLPFTRMVWVCCVALSVLTGIFLMADVATSFGNRQTFEESVTTSDVVTLIIGCICQQGTTLVPKTLSARIIIFLFSLCCLFFYTSYSANIVALLQSSSATFRSLSDLTNSPLGIGIQDVIYNKIFFGEATDENVRELYDKKIAPQGPKAYLNPVEGIKKLRSGMFAFDVEIHWGYKIISDTFHENEKCDLDEMRIFLLPKLSIPVVKKSGYREHFTRMNTWQRDVGLHSRIRQRWLPKKPICDNTGRGYVSVGLTDFKPALLVMVYGISFSIAAFFLELFTRSKLFYRCKFLNKSKRKRRKFNDWDRVM
ncbi:ionotropic receptor 75a isoform X2 [Halyomorpha halys]|nr:glutamate receptor ionotropic, kainate 4-like isoform X2 [Halyomorpha halys]